MIRTLERGLMQGSLNAKTRKGWLETTTTTIEPSHWGILCRAIAFLPWPQCFGHGPGENHAHEPRALAASQNWW